MEVAPERVFLTVDEVANKLRVSKMTVYRLIKQNKLRAHQIERAFRVTQDDYETYVASSVVV